MAKVSALIVDDAPFIRDLVKKALRGQFPGLQIEEAVNGRKAQQLLSRQGFDLILCDWEMPEMSGLELLQWFRGQPGSEKTPFIMVTSRGDKENVIEAIQSGVSDYIGKPFTNDQLTAHDSVSHLMGGKPSAPVAAPAPKPPAVNPFERPPQANKLAQEPAEKAIRGQAQLRLAGEQFACVVKALSLRDALVVVRYLRYLKVACWIWSRMQTSRSRA